MEQWWTSVDTTVYQKWRNLVLWNFPKEFFNAQCFCKIRLPLKTYTSNYFPFSFSLCFWFCHILNFLFFFHFCLLFNFIFYLSFFPWILLFLFLVFGFSLFVFVFIFCFYFLSFYSHFFLAIFACAGDPSICASNHVCFRINQHTRGRG